jgi:hypothetical protein
MDFLIADLMDEDARYAPLLTRLHPDGMTCLPGYQRERIGAHSRGRDPVLTGRSVGCRSGLRSG